MTRYLTTAALILALATPTFAGGPVFTTEETTEVSPARDRNGWIVPAVVGTLVFACLILCGNSDDAPPVVVPGPVCHDEGC